MLNVLKRFEKLALPFFNGRVSAVQTSHFRGIYPEPKASCYSPGLQRNFTINVSSCLHRYHVHTSHSLTIRTYSEKRSESSDSDGDGTEVQGETDADRRRFPERFSLDVLVSLLRQENAVDICVIKVPEQIKYTDYFIVVSGVSTRHLRAMALYAIKVYKFLKKKGEPSVKIEGKDTEDWMCIDFGKMVVHFMLPETREIYELEKLWTLRAYDEQLKNIPAEVLPEDFIYDADVTK